MSGEDTVSEVLSGLEDEPWNTQVALREIAADLLEPQPQLSDEGRRRRIDRLVATSKRLRIYNRDLQGVLEDLQAAGFIVDDLDTLRKPGVGGKGVLPILFKWLPLLATADAKHSVVTVLGEKWAGPASVQPLLDEFRRNNPANDPGPNSLRWFIAQSLAKVVDHRWSDDIVELIRDPRNETARYPLINSLGRMRKKADALIPILLEFLETDSADLYIPAARLLARWRVYEALPRIQHLLDTIDERPLHPTPGAWARDYEAAELKKALKAFAS